MESWKWKFSVFRSRLRWNAVFSIIRSASIVFYELYKDDQNDGAEEKRREKRISFRDVLFKIDTQKANKLKFHFAVIFYCWFAVNDGNDATVCFSAKPNVVLCVCAWRRIFSAKRTIASLITLKLFISMEKIHSIRWMPFWFSSFSLSCRRKVSWVYFFSPSFFCKMCANCTHTHRTLSIEKTTPSSVSSPRCWHSPLPCVAKREDSVCFDGLCRRFY